MRKLSLIVLLVAGIGMSATGAFGDKNEDAIKARKALMKSSSKINKAMKAADKAADMATVEKSAMELAKNFGNLANPCMFPKGSTAEGSRAKPAIWENWSDFEAKAKAAQTLAQAVATQAKAGNRAETAALVKGYSKAACGSCHKPYRAPKKKKM